MKKGIKEKGQKKCQKGVTEAETAIVDAKTAGVAVHVMQKP